MENAVEALKMAAAVLIFVLALSISINAFGEARIASKTILDYKDREYDYTYVEENKDAEGNVITERLVGLESIVPSIYKAYKENYKIVFEDGILVDGIYKKNDDSGNTIEINTIDLQNEVLGNDTQKEQFMMALLYGSDCIKNEKMSSSFTDWATVKMRFIQNLGIYLNDEGIYDKINNIKLKESIGIYYQEETPSDDGTSSGGTTGENVDVPDANKTIKRVITYTKP